jgi:hypothetical protein
MKLSNRLSRILILALGAATLGCHVFAQQQKQSAFVASTSTAIASPVGVKLRVGQSVDASAANLAFELTNVSKQPVGDVPLGTAPNCLALTVPNKRDVSLCANVTTISRSRRPVNSVYPEVPPQGSKLWQPDLRGYFYYLPQLKAPGLYRVKWNWYSSLRTDVARPSDLALLVESGTSAQPSSLPDQLYEKPILDPNDPDTEPTPTPPPPTRFNVSAPLEMAAVLDAFKEAPESSIASDATIAFIFTNQGTASTSVASLGGVGNGFTIVTPENRVIRQTLKAAAPTSIATGGQKVWKANVTAFFKGRKLTAPGWYQLFWKLGERKAGPLWLYKVPPATKDSTKPPAPATR